MALLEARNGIYEIRYYTLSHFSQNWVIPVISGFGGMRGIMSDNYLEQA